MPRRVNRYNASGSIEAVEICAERHNNGNICSLSPGHEGMCQAYDSHEIHHSRYLLVEWWAAGRVGSRTDECMVCAHCGCCIPPPGTTLNVHVHLTCGCLVPRLTNPFDLAQRGERWNIRYDQPGFLPASMDFERTAGRGRYSAAMCNAIAREGQAVCTRPANHMIGGNHVQPMMHAAHSSTDLLVRRWMAFNGEEYRTRSCNNCGSSTTTFCQVQTCIDQCFCLQCCTHGRPRHREQIMRFLGTPTKRYPRFVGVEVECGKLPQAKIAGYNNVSACSERWGFRIGSDGSLHDFQSSVEISTTPSRGDELDRQLTELAKALREDELKANASCGLHVHVDVRDYVIENLLNLVLLWTKIEKPMYRLVAPSRKVGTFSKPWLNAFKETNDKRHNIPTRERFLDCAVYGTVQSAQDHKLRRAKSGGRYRGMNLNAIAVHGTIEFRLHHGTVNEHKIKFWSAICSAIVEYAFKHTEEEIRALKGASFNILERVVDDEEIAAWMKERRLFFINQSRKRRGIAKQVGEKPVPFPERHAPELSEDNQEMDRHARRWA